MKSILTEKKKFNKNDIKNNRIIPKVSSKSLTFLYSLLKKNFLKRVEYPKIDK